MAKVLHEINGGRESAHLMLSPSVRLCPLALADRDRRDSNLATSRLGFSGIRYVACRRSISEEALNEPIRIEY
jgi:hypothetical protein